MLLEGRFGIWGASRGFLAVAAELVADCLESGRTDGVPVAWDMARVATSGFAVFKGGGYGDIETVVTEAECAWYTRTDWKAGTCTTCYNGGC